MTARMLVFVAGRRTILTLRHAQPGVIDHLASLPGVTEGWAMLRLLRSSIGVVLLDIGVLALLAWMLPGVSIGGRFADRGGDRPQRVAGLPPGRWPTASRRASARCCSPC